MSLQAALQPGSYQIEHDISLVRQVSVLSFPWKLHHTVRPGTIGIYCFKGRLRDADGCPNLYPPGTTIKFALFAAPPWSDATQEAIVVSQSPQRVKVTLRFPLPGLDDEPATLTALIRFEVTDPLKLIERTVGWERPGGLARLNAEIARDVEEAVQAVVAPLANRVPASPQWLTPSGAERLQGALVAAARLSERGLSLLGDQPPLTSVEYPPALLEGLRDLHAAYALWQHNLSTADEAGRRALAETIGGTEAGVREAIIAGMAPPLAYFVGQRPDLLAGMLAEASGAGWTRGQKLYALLISPTSGGFYRELLSGLLRDWEERTAPGRA